MSSTWFYLPRMFIFVYTDSKKPYLRGVWGRWSRTGTDSGWLWKGGFSYLQSEPAQSYFNSAHFRLDNKYVISSHFPVLLHLFSRSLFLLAWTHSRQQHVMGNRKWGWQRMVQCTDIASALQCQHPGSRAGRALRWEMDQFSFRISSLICCGRVYALRFMIEFVSCSFSFFGGEWGHCDIHTLQEAHCAYIHSKLLICSSDVHWSDVHDWQTGGFLCFVLQDSLAPSPCMFLWVERREMC